MKIVLISQRCFPHLGPRAHRTTELAKEFAKLGHEVIVYSLLGDYDYSEISKNTGINFKNLGNSRFGIADNIGFSNKNIFYRGFAKYIGSRYLEFPLIELIPMVQKALKKEGAIDYLITIAHPHTIHWGAAKYIKKNKNKIKFWVADCGDPYMKDPFNRNPFYFSIQEKKWGRLCNYITIPIEEARKAYYSEFQGKIRIIPQGFDFKGTKVFDYVPNLIPTFAYSGRIYRGSRDPTSFLEYLASFASDFKFIVYTKNVEFFASFKKNLGEKLEIRRYIPRKELLYELSKVDFLINIRNDSEVQQPSKLIDYALTTRPILEITSLFHENEQRTFGKFMNGDYQDKIRLRNVEKFDVENVAQQFIELFKENK